MMRFLVFYVLLLSQSSFAAFSTHWYTEDIYLGRESNLSSLVRLRGEYKISDVFSPYLTFGSDLQTQTNAYSQLTNNSYAFGGPGLKVNLFGATLYSELRGRSYFREAPNQKTIDARLLLVLGKYDDLALDASRSLLGFYELYSETLFTSLDENNLIGAAFVRSGLRKPILKELMVDAFLEPFVTVDRIGHFYNNRADLKLNLRVLYAQSVFSIGLTGSYLINHYFNYATFEKNPYQNEKTGFRFLFVAGGTF